MSRFRANVKYKLFKDAPKDSVKVILNDFNHFISAKDRILRRLENIWNKYFNSHTRNCIKLKTKSNGKQVKLKNRQSKYHTSEPS